VSGSDRNRESIYMNRHQRRAARAMGLDIVVNDTALSNAVYHAYGKHLPRVSVDAPFGDGTHHVYLFHKSWCRFFKTKRMQDCNCDPRIERHV